MNTQMERQIDQPWRAEVQAKGYIWRSCEPYAVPLGEGGFP
jgi:hypothetical protein